MNIKGSNSRERYRRRETGYYDAKSDSVHSKKDGKSGAYMGRFRRGVGDRTPPRFRVYEDPRHDSESYDDGYERDDRGAVLTREFVPSESRRHERPGTSMCE